MGVVNAGEGVWKLFGFLTGADLALIGFILLCLVFGYLSGLVWQIVRLVSVIVCLWASLAYHPVVADSLGSGLSEPSRRLLSAIGVFVLGLLCCYLIAFLFRDFINAIRPQATDRILGAAFGVAKGALIAGLVAFSVLKYGDHGGDLYRQIMASRASRTLAGAVNAFLYVLPDPVIELVEPLPAQPPLRAPRTLPATEPSGAAETPDVAPAPARQEAAPEPG